MSHFYEVEQRRYHAQRPGFRMLAPGETYSVPPRRPHLVANPDRVSLPSS
jgi:hypothetical protein